MASENLTKSQWTTLARRIYEGRCVPFLGAGANVHSSGSLPLGAEVAMRLVRELASDDEMQVAEKLVAHVKAEAPGLGSYEEFANLGLHDLGRVALHYASENDLSALVERLQTFIRDASEQLPPVLDTLARLRRKDGKPLRLIVSTNYDGLMEDALDKQNVQYEPVDQEIAGFDDATHRDLQYRLSDPDRLILYKIHGSFARNGSVVVTEEDYIQFLTVLRRRDDIIGVPAQIESELIDSTLLFLGYSLEDWDFRTIHKGLIETLRPNERRKSIAIQRNPSDFWVKFWAGKGVEIFDMEVSDFNDELVKACQTHEAESGHRTYAA